MSIIISVDVLETGQRTKAQFPGAVSVEEANAQLREKVHLDSGDFALFKVTRPADEVTAMTEAAIQKLRIAKGLKKEKKDAKKEEVPPEPLGVWLKPKKTLESYDLSAEDALMLRRRHKVIKVKTSDEASKSVIVDLAQPVKDVLVTIGAKFGLEHTEEYALQWERTERWLLNTQTITEQGNSNEVMVLKKRFYVTDSELDRNLPVQLHLAYIQGRESVVSGNHPVTKDEAAMFAALQAQVEYGIFNPQSHKPGFLELNRFVPPQYLKMKDMEGLVLRNWRSIGTMTTIDAKYKYHQLCMTLATYGKTMFSVEINTAPKGKKPQLVPVKLAFSATQVQQLSNDCRAIVYDHKYQHLRKWTYDENELMIDFGDHDDHGAYIYITDHGEDIATLIGGYIDILVRINRAARAEDTLIGAVAQVQSVGVVKGKVSVGLTVSSGSNEGTNNIGNITDLNSFREAFHSYQVPTVKELSAAATGVTLTFEQLNTQMASSATAIKRLMLEMQNAAAAHNAQELCNLAKNMGMVVSNLLSDAKRAAAVSKDIPHKQQLLASCSTLLQALERYTDALKAYEANPCPETLAALELAKMNIENAVECVMAAMRNNQSDPENGTLMYEMSKNVLDAVEQIAAGARQCAPGNAQVEQSCVAATQACQKLIATIETLGTYAADPVVRDIIFTQMRKIKPCTADIVQMATMANPAAVAPVLAQVKNVDQELRYLQYVLNDTGLDISASALPFLRAAHTVLTESALIKANAENRPFVLNCTAQIKACAPAIIAHAKEMNEQGVDPVLSGCNTDPLVAARQIAIATKMLVQQTAPEAEQQFNPKLVEKSGDALSQAVIALLGNDELTMHKVALVDRSKVSAASMLHLASHARTNVRTGQAQPDRTQILMQSARCAFDTVQALLTAVKKAVGTEGDERVNVNELSDQAVAYTRTVLPSVIVPISQEGAEYQEDVAKAAGDAQRLLEETEQYKIVGQLAAVEQATETFRAAEAVLQALLFANDADHFTQFGTREEALAQLHPAVVDFRESLKAVTLSFKQNQTFVEPLQKLSHATQAIITATRGLITNSRFKHERKLLVDAARELAIGINRLIELLRTSVRQGPAAVADDVAAAINASVSALHRIIAYAQKEGGQLVLDDGDAGGPRFDADLENAAEETLHDVKHQVDTVLAHLSQVSAALPPATDPRSTVNTAIVDSVGALVASTSAVVGAACMAQNELVVNLRQPATRMMYARDPSLADALIKAARHLQNAILDLTRGLNVDTVQTLSQQELATHAGAVSKSVEILAAAVRAGAKQGSSSLIDATRTVSDATRSLLEAAKMIEELPDEEDDTDAENFGIDAYTLQEIKIQMKIAELEHKLERARKKYQTLLDTKVSATTWNVV